MGCDNCRYLCSPEIPNNPDLIVVGEAPGVEEKRQGIPFVGPSGQIIRNILSNYNIHAIILNSQNCWTQDKPTPERISDCREKFLHPIIERYPKLPIVGLGEYSIHSITHRKGVLSGNIFKARMIGDHVILFTYHPAYYLRSRNRNVLDHIDTTIRTAITPITPRSFSSVSRKILPSSEKIIIDIETKGKDLPWYGTEPLIIGVRIQRENFILFPKDFDRPDIRKLFQRKDILFVGHNILFDLLILKKCFGLDINGGIYDTMIREKNWSTLRQSYGLKYFAKLMGFPPYEAEPNSILLSGNTLDVMPIDRLIQYCCYDLEATDRLMECQQEYGPARNFELEMEYIKIILNMINNGIYINIEKLGDIKSEYENRANSSEKIIYKEAGREFNLNSPKQVKEVLINLGIDVTNTKKETLEIIQNKHPFLKALVEYRSFSKVVNTFCGGYRKYIDNNIIHGSFSVHGTETTRMTSSSPNLQNTDPRIRPAFVSRYRNGRLISTDLNSLEYRLIAHTSGDSRLIRMFNENKDIHKEMAKVLYGKEIISKEERDNGKLGNYIVIYGGGIDKIRGVFNTAVEIAATMYERASRLYPEVDRWKKKEETLLYRNLYLYNMFGLRRDFEPPITVDICREAINWLIQSSGHQVLMVYIKHLVEGLPDGVLLVNEVHDEAIFDCPMNRVEEMLKHCNKIGGDLNVIIKKEFGVDMLVPMFSETSILENWK